MSVNNSKFHKVVWFFSHNKKCAPVDGFSSSGSVMVDFCLNGFAERLLGLWFVVFSVKENSCYFVVTFNKVFLQNSQWC